jgi:hypothetical protein
MKNLNHKTKVKLIDAENNIIRTVEQDGWNENILTEEDIDGSEFLKNDDEFYLDYSKNIIVHNSLLREEQHAVFNHNEEIGTIVVSYECESDMNINKNY